MHLKVYVLFVNAVTATGIRYKFLARKIRIATKTQITIYFKNVLNKSVKTANNHTYNIMTIKKTKKTTTILTTTPEFY